MQHSLECCVGRLLAIEPWALFPVTIQQECCFSVDWVVFVIYGTALASWDGNTFYWLGCFPYIVSTSLLYKFCAFPCHKGVAKSFVSRKKLTVLTCSCNFMPSSGFITVFTYWWGHTPLLHGTAFYNVPSTQTCSGGCINPTGLIYWRKCHPFVRVRLLPTFTDWKLNLTCLLIYSSPVYVAGKYY